MILPITQVGQYGILRDQPAHEIPLNAWSDGQNVRFREGKVEKIEGQSNAYDPPSIVPYNVLPVITPTVYFWLYAGLAKVYCTDQSAHFDITRAVGGDYAALADTNWTTAVLGGVPVINNGVDDPQMWNPVSSAQRLQLLSNWPANTKCNSLRSYRNFLVALDVTVLGSRNPYLVKWSHGAVSGAVPVTWDPTDTTKDAGEYSLVENGDFCIDSVSLRDDNVIYKDASVWRMQYIGGLAIFRFSKMFLQMGIMSRRCAAEYYTGLHAVLTHDDVVKHDGQNVVSLLTNKQRRWLFNRIDTTNYRRCFVMVVAQSDEVWFCYPSTGNSFCNEAVIWNYKFDTVGFRQLPQVADGKSGVVDTSATPSVWDSDPATWDSDSTVWDAANFNSSILRPLMAAQTTQKLVAGNVGTQFAGVNYTSYVERTGISVPAAKGAPPPNVSQVLFCRNVWPRIEGTIGGRVNVYIGSSFAPNVAPIYQAPQVFTIGTTRKIDCRVTGSLLAIKFESTDSTDWKLSGYDLDISGAGENG